MATEFYPFQSSDEERRRLIAQADVVGPLTQRLLERAGIEPGMRVLDIGCGPGDVAFLAARRVGREGSVVGVDRDPAQLALAARRAERDGVANVRFIEGDFRALALDASVDAIVGRLVLMYSADPLDALRRAVLNLRPGGVIALQESIIDYDGPVPIEPRDCLAARAVEWFRAGFRHAGVQPRMGLRLFGLMRAAGLEPAPDIDTLAPIQQGPELCRTLAAVVRSQLAAIVASGSAAAEEIDVDTLEQRLAADADRRTIAGYFHSGHAAVWARKP
jgi:SAM-dependent methyltransferase